MVLVVSSVRFFCFLYSVMSSSLTLKFRSMAPDIKAALAADESGTIMNRTLEITAFFAPVLPSRAPSIDL